MTISAKQDTLMHYVFLFKCLAHSRDMKCTISVNNLKDMVRINGHKSTQKHILIISRAQKKGKLKGK